MSLVFGNGVVLGLGVVLGGLRGYLLCLTRGWMYTSLVI